MLLRCLCCRILVWCLGRRSLNFSMCRRILGSGGMSAGASRLIGLLFAFRSPKFHAVSLQNLNKIVLCLDRFALLDDEHGHQTVRNQENHGERRHEAALFFRSRNRHNRRILNQSRQAPSLMPHNRRHPEECNLYSNGWNDGKMLNLRELTNTRRTGGRIPSATRCTL